MWFRTHCVDIREQDINKIHSSTKSWFYADQLLKPEEIVMFRPASYGGLEVQNVKYKALAALTRTFLKTACHPSFQRSLFHSNLFRFHVLNDTTIPNPGLPPFYSAQFFKKIRQVHLETPLNITTMTEKQWYRLYLEDFCTMESIGERQGHFIPTRIEESSPDTDWENSWKLKRLKGLGPEHTSFLFKLVHRLLVTRERLHRTNSAASPNCRSLGCQAQPVENLEHAFFLCPANKNVGKAVPHMLCEQHPHITAEAALSLDLVIQPDQELPLTWALTASLLSIWNQRQSSQKVQPYLVRAELEAKVNLLKQTRFEKVACIISKKNQKMFRFIDSC